MSNGHNFILQMKLLDNFKPFIYSEDNYFDGRFLTTFTRQPLLPVQTQQHHRLLIIFSLRYRSFAESIRRSLL